MASNVIIIGNGFDIDMGLPSRYSDFIKSKEWQEVIKRVEIFQQSSDYCEHSLIGQLQRVSHESQWFDIEEEIHKFVLSHNNNTEQAIGEIRNEFELIKDGLSKYLTRVSTNFKADEKRISYIILYFLQYTPSSIAEFNFNYTNPRNFLQEKPSFISNYIFSVHGSLSNEDVVLGCNLKSNEEVNRQLSFMYKYNMLKRPTNIAQHLLEAKDVIFFGHSINEMDFRYFKEFFKAASASPNPIRHLTIITYDEVSERNIKDNIQSQGISVTDLYNNLSTFDFIHTQSIYNEEEQDYYKLKDLLERIKGN